MNFEDLQVQVHPGPGMVARFSGAAAVLAQVSPSPGFDDELLAVIAAACEQYGPRPGRNLMRKVAGVITNTEPEDVTSFAVAADTPDGLAVLLCGNMDLRVCIGADEQTLSGHDVATWVDRVIHDPFERLEIFPTGAGAPEVESRVDLRDGVVPGSGITFVPRATTAPARVPGPAAPAAGERAVAAGLPTPPRGSELMDRLTHDASAVVAGAGGPPMVSVPFDEPLPEEELTPLPLADEPASPVGAADEPGPSADEIRVQGILCSRDHFNDPKARFCAQCGISMVHQTHNYVSGPRPALGVLVLDDGATFAVDHDYVIGREPEYSELVQSGEARPLVLEDSSLRLSREHARIRLRDWEVCVEDAHSANGTRIKVPDSSEWITLKPDIPTPIAPGTWIGLSDRELLFQSHFAAG